MTSKNAIEPLSGIKPKNIPKQTPPATSAGEMFNCKILKIRAGMLTNENIIFYAFSFFFKAEILLTTTNIDAATIRKSIILFINIPYFRVTAG